MRSDGNEMSAREGRVEVKREGRREEKEGRGRTRERRQRQGGRKIQTERAMKRR